MRRIRFSHLAKELMRKSLLVFCVLALLAIGCMTRSIPAVARTVGPEMENVPQACTELGPSSLGAAGRGDLLWHKSVLRVRFLDGSAPLKAQVRNYAKSWSSYANVNFEFVETEPSDIRVSFAPGGSWSYIGTSANGKDVTMNFGWFDENKTTVDVYRRTILHEFGHALGLVHEHQSPAAVIKWNKPVVYKYYRDNFRWNASVVNENIFEKYEGTQIQYSAYDPASIMHYPIPAAFTTDGFSVPWNTNLSEQDKALIKSLYPKPASN